MGRLLIKPRFDASRAQRKDLYMWHDCSGNMSFPYYESCLKVTKDLAKFIDLKKYSKKCANLSQLLAVVYETKN